MSLVIQLVACAGAVVIIAALVHGDAKRSTIAVSSAALAAVVVALVGLQGLWPTAKQHFEVAKGQRALSSFEATVAGGRQVQVNADFVEWAAGQMRPDDRYHFESNKDGTALQWTTYRMLPRLAVETPRKGQVVVFYNTTYRRAGYSRRDITDLRMYQPTFSIARLARDPAS